MSNREKLPPNYEKLDVALRAIGYSFEDAVADVIDNSIDAKSRWILIRLALRNDSAPDIVIWDDGVGMSRDQLREAMRFGSDLTSTVDRLGKFGLGMKLASLSQAKSLILISKYKGILSGRAWFEDGIKEGFLSDELTKEQTTNFLTKYIPDIKWAASGTVVIWRDMYRLKGDSSNPESFAQKQLNVLGDHLSLVFHRFLSGKIREVTILMDLFDIATSQSGLNRRLQPLDPFGYNHSGHPDFPVLMQLPEPYSDKIKMEAHVWPPKSAKAEYRLPGGANIRQGFYFYRNDRLIQGGGWNGLRESDTHFSLARVALDIHEDFDLEINLNVRKVEITLPIEIKAAIQRAETKDRVSLSQYLAAAEKMYRTITRKEEELPVVIGSGAHRSLRKLVRDEFVTSKSNQIREIDMVWRDLPVTEFFRLDFDSDQIQLNGKYRNTLTSRRGRSSFDAPVLKSLLFIHVRDLFFMERIGPKRVKQLAQLNRILVRAVELNRTI